MAFILSLNAGSSSLKISLYSLDGLDLLLSSSISSISSPPAHFSFISSTKNTSLTVDTITDHASAFKHFLDALHNDAAISSAHIKCVCHRVVHGGDYHDPVIITREAFHHIEKLSDLAPLHNGAALSVIQASIDALPHAKSIAYFDTAFHTSIPTHISSYPINQSIAKERGLRKYGFHGLSYAFIVRSVAHHLQQPKSSLNLIVLHLGSGASACAIQGGRALDTSMGLTPLSGLPGATRSGAVDPSLIFHYTNRAGRITHDPSMATHVGVTAAEDILNRKAGWKALTGTTDFGEITAKADLSNPIADPENVYRLAFDLFLDRIIGYIGSYYLKLEGKVHALVFAGGIGEHSEVLRQKVAEKVECLGFEELSGELNKGQRDEVVWDVSRGEMDDRKREKRILVCKTDEQLEMARECAHDKTMIN